LTPETVDFKDRITQR